MPAVPVQQAHEGPESAEQADSPRVQRQALLPRAERSVAVARIQALNSSRGREGACVRSRAAQGARSR